METVHSDEAKRALLESSSLLMRVLYDTYTRAFASLSTIRFTRSVLNSSDLASLTTSSPSALVSTLPPFSGAALRAGTWASG